MTQPHSDSNTDYPTEPPATQPHGGGSTAGQPFATLPPCNPMGGDAFAGGMLPPGGLSLLGGKYVATERCAGGMGVVYKCVKRATGQVVALKTVLSDGPMSEDEIRSMRRNYDRVHGLSHDHIVRVNALEVDDGTGQWYVEMDWVEGESLEGRRRQLGEDVHLVAREAIRILRQIAQALDYAHSRGVVHRDVKDANIMVDKGGRAVLIDFGIASRAPHVAAPNGTQPHAVTATATVSVFAGTPGYQSPEQWRGERAEGASDEYSLAVTAYRCLSGHLPFWSVNEGELQEMVLHAEVPSIVSIPKEANAVLKKALAKQPSERYRSCTAFIDELEKGLSSLAGSANDSMKSSGVEEEVSFSMSEYYILSGEMEEKFSESRKHEWDRAQTFGDHLDTFSKAMKGAKGAVVNKDFPAAYSFYRQAEDEWKWLEVNGPLRDSSAACREKALEKQNDAKRVGMPWLKATELQNAVDCLKKAEDNFTSGRFEDSEKGFKVAEKAFADITEAAKKAKKINELEMSIKEAVGANGFQDARYDANELMKLDAVAAASWNSAIDMAEAAWKKEQIATLEKSIREAIESNSFQDIRHDVNELMKFDAGKAASWEKEVESARKAARIAELEKSIHESIGTNRFLDAHRDVVELMKLDSEKAVSLEKAVESARKAKRIAELEKSIRESIETNRFQYAHRDVVELMKLDSEKAASLEMAIESVRKAKRIEELEESIRKAIDIKCFYDARRDVVELMKLDSEKAAPFETAVEAALSAQKAGRIAELEKSIRQAIDEKRFQDTWKAIGELRMLDAAKAAPWEAAIDQSLKAKRVKELNKFISKALGTKRLVDARHAVGELRSLNAAKAESWEAAIEEEIARQKKKRVEELEKSIREAVDVKHYLKARQTIVELNILDLAKAESWEAAIRSLEKKEKTRKRIIGIVICCFLPMGVLAFFFMLASVLDPADADMESEPTTDKTELSVFAPIPSQTSIESTASEQEPIKPTIEINDDNGIGQRWIQKANIEKKDDNEDEDSDEDRSISSRITVHKEGDNYVVTLKNGVEIRLVKVEAGSFQMGSENGKKDEKPVHKVTLTEDFWLGETEVTQAQYAAVMDRNPSYYNNGDNYPVESVSWEEAERFCEMLCRLCPGYSFRLPTEAQWEYAARGGKKTRGYKYSGSDYLSDVGQYGSNSESRTYPVKRKAANELGLYDMSGNVYEWCHDWYGRYPDGEITDPEGPISGTFRVGRGGSWGDKADFCRSSDRSGNKPSYYASFIGFRVLCVPTTQKMPIQESR